MLTATTTQSIWQAIRRLERAVAEQDRRTPTSPAAASTGAERVAPSGPGALAPMAPAAPVTIRPGAPGLAAGQWVTVFEAPAVHPAAELPAATLTAYVRVRAELVNSRADDQAADEGAAPPAVRLVLGAAELWRGPVAVEPADEPADPDGYATVGPLGVPAAELAAGAVSLVRVQLRAPAGATVTAWPPWLVWHAEPDPPGPLGGR